MVLNRFVTVEDKGGRRRVLHGRTDEDEQRGFHNLEVERVQKAAESLAVSLQPRSETHIVRCKELSASAVDKQQLEHVENADRDLLLGVGEWLNCECPKLSCCDVAFHHFVERVENGNPVCEITARISPHGDLAKHGDEIVLSLCVMLDVCFESFGNALYERRDVLRLSWSVLDEKCRSATHRRLLLLGRLLDFHGAACMRV